jgi:type IV secretion system protein VirD4
MSAPSAGHGLSSEERLLIVLVGGLLGAGIVGLLGADLASLLAGRPLPHQAVGTGLEALIGGSHARALWRRPPPRVLVLACDGGIAMLIGAPLWQLWHHRERLAAHLTGTGAQDSRARRAREAKELGCEPRESPGILFGDNAFGRYDEPVFVVGQPGSGKSVWLVRNVLHTPGPSIITSTKPELVILTAGWHAQQHRPVFVWDLAGTMDLDEDLRLRWDPLASVARQADARIMARRFALASGLAKADDSHWVEAATGLLAGLFWAAVLRRRSQRTTMADVRDWALVPSRAREPTDILDGFGYTTEAQELRRVLGDEAAARGGGYTASVLGTVAAALGGFAEAALLDACSPADGEHFDVARFVEEKALLYIVGSPESQRSAAGVVAAMIEDTLERVRRYRLPQRPPLLLWLDEAPNMAVLGSLPEIVTTGRGEGICPVIIGQTLAKFTEAFGEHGAETIRGACVVELAYGGQRDVAYLRSLEALSGETAVESWSYSYGTERSATKGERTRARLTVEELRSLGKHKAWLVTRQGPIRAVRTTPWWQHREDGPRVAAAVAWAVANGYAKDWEVPNLGRYKKRFIEAQDALVSGVREEVAVDALY